MESAFIHDQVIQIRGLKKRYTLGQYDSTRASAGLRAKLKKLMGKEPAAQAEAQSGSWQEFWALKGIDLDVYRGDTLGIIGLNGSGKSTLLKLISRITAPTCGEIGICGVSASMLEIGTGFNGDMTGRENIYLNGTILGMTRSEIDKKMQAIIDFSECGKFIDTPVKRYSSGMYVRLAFSVSAFLDSDILIMDEVLAVGDTHFQKKCINKMADAAHSENRTVLFVSHNMNSIRQLCTRCIVLNSGEKIFDGGVEDAISLYSDINHSARREETLSDGLVAITGVTLHNGADVGIVDDNMRLQVDWISNVDDDDAHLQFLFHSDLGVPVGMSYCEAPVCLKKGQPGSVSLSIDIALLAMGTYNLDVLFVHESNLKLYPFAQKEDALHFARRAIYGSRGLLWDGRQYGSLRFPVIDPELEK